MEYCQAGDHVEITGVTDFDPVHIFECGQCFRWNAEDDGAYVGVAMGRAARVYMRGDVICITGTVRDFEDVWRGYFDLDRDYESIRKNMCIDGFMTAATQFGAGIRILRQDKWEALCSFIISQCNNIPRIKKIVETMCAEFGDAIEFEGRTIYTFPSAQRIAALEVSDLAPLRSGYRAQYIIDAARAVASGALDLEAIALADFDTAKRALKAQNGIGDKVANCVILFGLQMLNAFPIDVWIKKVLSEHYGKDFDPNIFAPYAGIAQQYMFYYARTNTNADTAVINCDTTDVCTY